MAYNSDEDEGDVLFTHDTVATMPLSNPLQQKRDSTPETAFVTQATQLLRSSPLSQVQVAASSPRTSTTPGPLSNSSYPHPGGRLAHLMAPPGTQFRAPGWPTTAQSQSQRARSQTVECNDKETQIIESSSDEERARPVKKTIFTRNGVPINQPQTTEVSRVEESPQSKPLSKYKFQGAPTIPQKRTADAMASAYGGSSRTPKQPRTQDVPAKAAPIAMTLDDIKDFDVRRKIEDIQNVFICSVDEAYVALKQSQYHYEDALDKIGVAQDKKEQELKAAKARTSTIDLVSDDEQQVANKPVAKRSVANAKSIQEKWGGQTAPQKVPNRPIVPRIAAPSTPEKPTEHKYPKKKKLVRPQRPSSPLPSSPPAIQKTLTTQKAPGSGAKPTTEDIDEGIEISSGNDSEADEPEVTWSTDLEAELLQMFNTCTIPELIELSTQPSTVIEQVLEKRPFKSLDAVRAIIVEQKSKSKTKTGKEKILKKKIGERLVDVSLEMLESYRTVDQLVAECAMLGNPIQEEMRRFGFDTSQGELKSVEFDHDSGIGTPSSTASIEPEDRRKQLRKPEMMSDDLILKDYQEVGLNWLALLYSKKMSGILADDMGLGKTCQVIAFLSHLCESGKSTGVHLIIVPGSTLENWLREFHNFCPALNVRPYYGSQAEREELRLQLEEDISSGDVNVIVTTYDMAKSKEDNRFLRRLEPNVCVYDEGHALKNSQSQRYEGLMRIKAQFRLLLTGTPLQNNLQELMSLLAFIMPQVFKDRMDELRLLFKAKAKTTNEDNHAALLSKQRIDRARSMMTPFILRRKKQQVLKHLPAKTIRTAYCTLTPAQRDVYDSENAKVTKFLREQGSQNQTQKAKSNVMMKLRQAAIHPLLFRRHFNDKILRNVAKAFMRTTDDVTVQEQLVYEDLEQMTDFELNRFCDRHPRQMSKFKFDRDVYLDSGKVRNLVEILKRHKENGDRTLVFSQFTMVMDILEQVFEIEQISFSRLDGSTKMAERQDLIDQFYQDESIQVFMLSTGAGGAGINLACANKVVIFDSSFNPHQDVQAENRAHRVGQKREVEVIKLVTESTIEEQIQALGRTKLALDERVAGEGDESQDSKQDDQAEKEGMEIVEQMLLEGKTSDVKDDYLEGLKSAGLKVS